MVQSLAIGAELKPLVKHVTQEKINMFEACGLRGEGTSNFHTDPDAAMRTIGLATPIASGRVQLSFVAEALRKFFGTDVFDRSGKMDLRFVKPVVHGDVVTVSGQVASIEDSGHGSSVTVEVRCENQKGERTSMGTAVALIPKK